MDPEDFIGRSSKMPTGFHNPLSFLEETE